MDGVRAFGVRARGRRDPGSERVYRRYLDIYTAVDISTYLHIYTVTPAHVRLDSLRVARPRLCRNITNKFRHTDPSKVIIINIHRWS